MIEREVRLERAVLIKLENRWRDACDGLGLVDKQAVGEFWLARFDEVALHYIKRPGYHNLDHLSFMFRLLDQYRDVLKEPQVVDLAVFFHDVVHNPQSRTNTEESAIYAERMLGVMGASDEVARGVAKFVVASKHHAVRPGANDDLAYFLDGDMAILGTDKDSYRKYAAGVVLDFKAIGALSFIDGRQKFLEGLKGKRIFSTDEMHARFHDAAQENIAEEIEQWKKIKASLTPN